ncbi:PilZ domain-containing protein, partial [Acinetobacter baumannii]
VDRRAGSRVVFQRAGTLARRGETRRIEVRDVSLGAVSIECELPDAMIGEPVELAIDGLSFRLGGVVARMDRGSVLISLN